MCDLISVTSHSSSSGCSADPNTCWFLPSFTKAAFARRLLYPWSGSCNTFKGIKHLKFKNPSYLRWNSEILGGKYNTPAITSWISNKKGCSQEGTGQYLYFFHHNINRIYVLNFSNNLFFPHVTNAPLNSKPWTIKLQANADCCTEKSSLSEPANNMESLPSGKLTKLDQKLL